MQNRSEQVYSRDPNVMAGRGHLAFRDRQIDPALIQARRDAAEMEQRRKGFLRSHMILNGWANYQPIHRANARG